jgi:hypothetical protein
MLAGVHGMKAGISIVNHAIQSSIAPHMEIPKFPDSREGQTLEAVSRNIRILASVSVGIRIEFLTEEIYDSCQLLRRGEYDAGVKSLQLWFLHALSKDLTQSVTPLRTPDSVDELYEVLKLALTVLYVFGGNPSKPFTQMDIHMRALFVQALNFIGNYVSARGPDGERAFGQMDGYTRLIMPVNKTLLSDYKIVDAWLNAAANICLARIEAKDELGKRGAIQICLDSLRLHCLRPHIVQKVLWTLCTLSANHPANTQHILSWNSDSWNAANAKAQLLSVQRSKGQTTEARDHAALILSWMELHEAMASKRDTQKQKRIHDSMKMQMQMQDNIHIENDDNGSRTRPDHTANAAMNMEKGSGDKHKLVSIAEQGHGLAPGRVAVCWQLFLLSIISLCIFYIRVF